MPRPGPRPYECVKRAWHSDRHQPMRGLIIQQIFRLIHDCHCAETKKNREWLEKLPVVVLKSEEILYSKANSEAEYSNSETLWDRVNEAIDTIIRKDESTETGEFLLPCIEAALTLGCVPVRASRSQRNSNPRPYLRTPNQENSELSPNVSAEKAIEQQSKLMPLCTGSTSTLKMLSTDHSPHIVLESNKRLTLDSEKGVALSCGKMPCSVGNQSAVGFHKVGPVYPLYRGTNFQPEGSWFGFQGTGKSDDVIVGVPVIPSSSEHTEVWRLQNLYPHVTEEMSPAGSKDNNGKRPQIDLSLRLGPSPGSDTSRGKVPDTGTDYVVCGVPQVGSQPRDKEFHFFPVESSSAYDPHRLHSINDWNSDVENQNAESTSRKRKLPVTVDVDNEQCSWLNDLTSNHFYDQMKRSGL